MKVSQCAILSAAFLSVGNTATASSRHVNHALHERRDGSSPWIKRDALSATFTLPMRVGLTQGNLHRGQDMLMDVSNPQSENYGRYHSAKDLHNIFSPSDESVAAVREWLIEFGIADHRISHSTNKQWIQFDAQTHEAEELLKTTFHVYEHLERKSSGLGCDEYHVPEHVQRHIDYITPGITMYDASRRDSRSTHAARHSMVSRSTTVNHEQKNDTLKYCSTIITPACVQALYNIPLATTAVRGNELGIYQIVGENVDSANLDLFFKNMYPRIPQGTFPQIDLIDGAENINKVNKAGSEALTDLGMAYPIVYPQKIVTYITDDQYGVSHTDVPYVGVGDLLNAIDGSFCHYTAFGVSANNSVEPQYPNPGFEHPRQCGVFKGTNVISLSGDIPQIVLLRGSDLNPISVAVMKLGLQGISIVFSSGDGGPGVVTDGKYKGIYNPSTPASCPYVTTVGATHLTSSIEKHVEHAANEFAGGGGFSNIFPRPSYQDAAVKAWFKSPGATAAGPFFTGSDVANGLYNRSGRGYPDVAAVGQNMAVFSKGFPIFGDGTSPSTPIVAAILTRINELRLKAGKPIVGFVNPVLYQNPQAFFDIVGGGNGFPAYGTPGFNATKGWDPVTGLGTPNYPELLKAFGVA